MRIPLPLPLSAAASLCAASPAAAEIHVVTLQGITFSPAHITIDEGDTVRWQWVDDFHSTTEGSNGIPGGAWDEPIDPSSPQFTLTFDAGFLAANPRPGDIYDYFCIPHEIFGMTGSVTVVTGGAPPGTNYCTATVNSTAQAAAMAGAGSGSITGNCLVLIANDVPQTPGIGIFIGGPSGAQIPFFNGNLCVSPQGLQRINQVTPPVNGTVTQLIDFTGASTGTAPLNVVAGQPFRFQYWFRDPMAGGANANFTDGYRVPITP